MQVRQKNIVSRFALVVPPTPYIARRFTPTTVDAAVISSEPDHGDEAVSEAVERIQFSSPNKITGTSLPSDFGGGKGSTVHRPPGSNSFPQINSGRRTAPTKIRASDSDQPSIDVDSSATETPLGNSKRQTVIFASVNKSSGKGVDEEDTVSVESMVFIHIELPLFPLSAFVPKTLQEAAAAAKNNKYAIFTIFPAKDCQ